MLVMKGGSMAFGSAERPALPPPVATYPWSATGSIDVEELLAWAFNVQRVGSTPTRGLFEAEALASGLAWFGASSDGCAAVERIGTSGCRIDVSGPGRDIVHPVAEAVADAVARSPAAALLRHYARLGSRPQWRAPSRWLVPVSWVVDGEEAAWVYLERRTGAHCPLIRVCDTASVNAMRAAYLSWWDALEAIAWSLSARALGFTVDAPAAARDPWGETA